MQTATIDKDNCICTFSFVYSFLKVKSKAYIIYIYIIIYIVYIYTQLYIYIIYQKKKYIYIYIYVYIYIHIYKLAKKCQRDTMISDVSQKYCFQQFLFYLVHICVPLVPLMCYCESVPIWQGCIVNISKTIYNNFETHFGMLRYVEKPWQRRNTNFL